MVAAASAVVLAEMHQLRSTLPSARDGEGTRVSAATGSSRSHSEHAAYDPHGDTESDEE
jgi:hypothetical protein